MAAEGLTIFQLAAFVLSPKTKSSALPDCNSFSVPIVGLAGPVASLTSWSRDVVRVEAAKTV